jgi:tRNA-dihydrouridine synthase B
MHIGTLKLQSRFILAPLAGISDLPFRMLNRSFGAELAFVEMINVRCLSHKSKKTRQMLLSEGEPRPLGVQLLGCEPEYIEKGMEVINTYPFDLVDFNAACPERKVVRRGEGASLLREPKKLQRLLRLVKKDSRVPVTVKIRAGWDSETVNAPDVAKMCEDAGVSALFIHGRTRMQLYTGSVDYGVIGRVKRAISIPVIASGDVFSVQLAEKMFSETGCDGLVVARGCLGNPWLFRELEAHFDKKAVFVRPALDEIRQVMLENLESYIRFYGERSAVVIFRKFFAWYTKGLRKVRPVREKISRVKSAVEMKAIIGELFAHLSLPETSAIINPQ